MQVPAGRIRGMDDPTLNPSPDICISFRTLESLVEIQVEYKTSMPD